MDGLPKWAVQEEVNGKEGRKMDILLDINGASNLGGLWDKNPTVHFGPVRGSHWTEGYRGVSH